jgi:Phosphate transporter family
LFGFALLSLMGDASGPAVRPPLGLRKTHARCIAHRRGDRFFHFASAAAEATGATILLVAGNLGMPVSTTHAITTSIMGVGLAKHWKALDFILAERIVWAWIFTIPATGALAYGFYSLFGFF